MITLVISIAALAVAALALVVAAGGALEHEETLKAADDLFADHEERIADLESQVAGIMDGELSRDCELSPEAYAKLIEAAEVANEEAFTEVSDGN